MIHKTLYAEVAEKIAVYIKENWFQPGDKLPTYRELAERFNVSVHTVSNALERLQYKGVVSIRPQSGVFVMGDAWKALWPDRFNWQDYFQKSKRLPFNELKRFSEARERDRQLKQHYILSNLNLSAEFGSFAIWKKALDKVSANIEPESLSLMTTEDFEEIRGELIEHLGHSGLNIQPEEVILCRGSNYSLLFIAQTFFTPGTVCYYVSPSILNSSALFDMCGLVGVPLPEGDDGLDIEYFSAKINKRIKSFLIISPELSIMGKTMSLAKREALYNLCYANKIPIVEIDVYRDYNSNPLPSLRAMDKHGIVFHVGSFFDTVNNAMEIGWISAKPELIERLHYISLSMWISTDLFGFRIMCEALKSGDYREYVTRMQARFRRLEMRLNEYLTEHLGDIATWNRNAQVFFWIQFHESVDVKKIVNNIEGLTVKDGDSFPFAPQNTLFISLMGIKEDDLLPIVKLLSRLARMAM